MRRFLICLTLGAVLVVFGCTQEQVTAPSLTPNGSSSSFDAEGVAWALVDQASWPVEVSDAELREMGVAQREIIHPPFLNAERTHVFGDIYHYYWEIPVGPGPYEVIGLHRVVKERKPFKPIRTARTLFALHGTPGHFEVIFLPGSVVPSAPDDQSIAVFLAQNDVDVWGIDQAYTLLPADITDFSFMDGWGMEFDANNLRNGMAVARLVRQMTGNGRGKMNLLGYSTGFSTGFAALNMETQLPERERHIGGFIPVDYAYKSDDPLEQDGSCAKASAMLDLLQGGVYQNNYGQLFQTLGYLAQYLPSDPSPIIPGFNNLQAALLAGAMTGTVFGWADTATHFFAGVFDENWMPVDLHYTNLTHFLEWLQAFNNFGSNFMEYDIAVIGCDQEDSPHDDYLSLIEVPVFFLGAGGGFGDGMDYTASLLTGCSDVTLLNVQLQTPKLLDIGHCDIFTAEISQQEFWTPILQWIEAHEE